eukprot:m.63684 g.63684  ORF g.63684 m.63684 type:complete len:728 (+) comp8084_c0_seq2:122-2305(+)
MDLNKVLEVEQSRGMEESSSTNILRKPVEEQHWVVRHECKLCGAVPIRQPKNQTVIGKALEVLSKTAAVAGTLTVTHNGLKFQDMLEKKKPYVIGIHRVVFSMVHKGTPYVSIVVSKDKTAFQCVAFECLTEVSGSELNQDLGNAFQAGYRNKQLHIQSGGRLEDSGSYLFDQKKPSSAPFNAPKTDGFTNPEDAMRLVEEGFRSNGWVSPRKISSSSKDNYNNTDERQPSLSKSLSERLEKEKQAHERNSLQKGMVVDSSVPIPPPRVGRESTATSSRQSSSRSSSTSSPRSSRYLKRHDNVPQPPARLSHLTSKISDAMTSPTQATPHFREEGKRNMEDTRESLEKGKELQQSFEQQLEPSFQHQPSAIQQEHQLHNEYQHEQEVHQYQHQQHKQHEQYDQYEQHQHQHLQKQPSQEASKEMDAFLDSLLSNGRASSTENEKPRVDARPKLVQGNDDAISDCSQQTAIDSMNEEGKKINDALLLQIQTLNVHITDKEVVGGSNDTDGKSRKEEEELMTVEVEDNASEIMITQSVPECKQPSPSSFGTQSQLIILESLATTSAAEQALNRPFYLQSPTLFHFDTTADSQRVRTYSQRKKSFFDKGMDHLGLDAIGPHTKSIAINFKALYPLCVMKTRNEVVSEWIVCDHKSSSTLRVLGGTLKNGQIYSGKNCFGCVVCGQFRIECHMKNIMKVTNTQIEAMLRREEMDDKINSTLEYSTHTFLPF